MKRQAQHSAPLCHVLWHRHSPLCCQAASAKSRMISPKSSFAISSFQAGSNAHLLIVNAGQFGFSNIQI